MSGTAGSDRTNGRRRTAAGRRVTRLAVSITDGRGRPVRVPGLGAWLTRIAPASARGDVAIALASDRTVRALNRTYRGQDRATDVLSFASDANTPAGGERHLGDIVVARGVAARQAREAGHSMTTELKVLALHGLLHLLGFDHEVDAGEMARVETRLRRRGGLPPGLIERGGRA